MDEASSETNRISRVWAVIRPPNFQPGSASNPVQDLPIIELLPTGIAEQYRGSYDQFNIPGRYQITIYAKDRNGRSASPKQTEVTVDSQLRRRAIILAGTESSQALQIATENNSQAAYLALKRQGYSDEDIYYLSNVGTSGIDVPANLSNLMFALNQWQMDDTQDLTIYLTGENTQNQSIKLNNQETVSFQELSDSLDSRQLTLPGLITVIYDASQSAEIISFLSKPQRIIISSSNANQSANFLNQGELSFSGIFWNKVLQGSNVRDAFRNAINGLNSLGNGQSPQLDDNGNAISNDRDDGRIARNFTLGQGVFVAEDEPQIIDSTPDQTIIATQTTGLWLNVSSVKPITEGFAIITRPDFQTSVNNQAISNLPTIKLNCQNNRCQGQYDDFDKDGEYHISLYAKDQAGTVTQPQSVTITKQTGTPPFAGAFYNEQTEILRLYKVQAGNQQYYAELRNTGDFVFSLNALIEIVQVDKIVNADYQFDSRKLTIPEVFALGQFYHVEMKMLGNGLFSISSVN